MTSYTNTRSVLSGDPSVNLTVAQPHYHQFKRAIAHMSRWLVGGVLAPFLATASPLLTLNVNSIAIVGAGDASMASGVTRGWVSWNYFKSINPAAQQAVALGTLFQINGPAQRVLVQQLYDPGLFANASSTIGSDSEYIQEVISGTWTLSETAMVRRDIYLEDIRTYAAAYGNVYSGEASATVDTIFNVDQFTNRDLVGGFGKT